MSPKKLLFTLLRKSERYTKTDMIYLAHGGFWLSFWQTSTALSSLATSVAFAYFLPKEVFGNYKYILSLAAIAGSFSLSGISGAVTQAVAKGYEQTLTAAFHVNLKWGVFVTLVSWLMAIYYFIQGNNVLALALFSTGFLLPFYNNFNLYGAFLSGKKYFKENAIYGTILSVVPAVILIASFFVTHNPAILVIVSLSTGVLIAGIFYVRVLRKHSPGGGVSTEALTYGKHASFMGVIGVVAVQVDSILVFHYIGAAELAAYALALAFPQHIWNLFRNISTLALPKFAQKNIQDAKEILLKKMAVLSFTAAILSLCYILIAPFLYKIFFPQYPESVAISQLISLSLIGISSILPLAVLQATLATKKVYEYTFISSAFHIMTAMIFIPLWGMWGAAISFTATRLFSLALSLFLTRDIQITGLPKNLDELETPDETVR